MREYFIKFRPLSYIFRKDWYVRNRLKCTSRPEFAINNYYWITDIGFITIGRRKRRNEKNY